uniref:Uncharacterized protein n=1 Tax=Anguilla anguilla TaxID=7936 RepID=A0A0E9UDS5_ANGAN
MCFDVQPFPPFLHIFFKPFCSPFHHPPEVLTCSFGSRWSIVTVWSAYSFRPLLASSSRFWLAARVSGAILKFMNIHQVVDPWIEHPLSLVLCLVMPPKTILGK